MNQRLNLMGRTFTRLKVIEPAPDTIDRSGKVLVNWKCRCVCGKTKVALGRSLVRGATKSCGCLFADQSAARRRHYGGGGIKSIVLDNPLDEFDDR